MARDPRPQRTSSSGRTATGTPADPLEISPAQLAALTDPARCPSCGADLTASTCSRCGVDLGQGGAELWRCSREAAELLRQRAGEIERLRAAALDRAASAQAAARLPAAVPVLTPAPPVPTPAAAPVPTPAPPLPTPPPAPPGRPLPPTGSAAEPQPGRSGAGVHGVLVGLGALLLSVAALGFLIFSWRVLPLAGRAAVIGGCTVAVLAIAVWLRPRLRETAEAVGALGVVLVLADGWAVRRTGLLSADQPESLAYAAGAAAVSAVVLGAWAFAGRIRAGSLAASALAPLAVVLAGAQLSSASDSSRELALGLVCAAALAAARRRLPGDWRAERVLLRAAALMGLTLAAAISLPSLAVPNGWAGLVLLTGAAVAALQSVADRPAGIAGRRETAHMLLLRRAWSAAAGALAAGTAVPLARAIGERADLDPAWIVAITPALAGLVVLALARVRTGAVTGVRRSALTAGGAIVAAAAAMPAVATAGWQAGQAAWLAADPWSLEPRSVVGAAMEQPLPDVTWLASLIGLLAAAAWPVPASRIARAPGWLSRPLRYGAAIAAAVAVLALPLAPALPLWAVLAGLTAGAVGAVLVATGPARSRPFLRAVCFAASAVIGSLAVVAAWSTPELSVLLTAAGVAALLLARRAVPGVARWPLAALAAMASTVVAGAVAGLAGAPVEDRVVIAAAVGALLAAAALTLPERTPVVPGRAPWSVGDRIAAAVAAALPFGVNADAGAGVIDAGVVQDAAGAPWQPQLLVLSLLVAALAAATRTRPAVVAVVGWLPVAAASAVVPLTGVLVLVTAPDVLPMAEPSILLAVVAAACAALIAILVLLDRLADPRRRLGAEAGLALVGLGALVAVVAAEQLWIVLMLLGAAAAAIAAIPQQARIGWISGLLLTGSTWTRLVLSDVTTIEAYTLPPAAALLVVGALRLRRDPAASAPRALAPGATLALVPSILAAGDGRVRPSVLIVLGALLVLIAAVLERRPAGRLTDRVAPVLVAAGASAAAGTAAVRVVAALDDVHPNGVPPAAVEPWSLAAAGVLVLAALLTRSLRRGVLLSAALLTAAVPSLLAALDPLLDGAPANPVDGWRVASVLAVAIACCLGTALLVRRLVELEWTALAVAGAATLTGLVLEAGPAAELWTMSLAALLLVLGADRMAREPVASWPALGPGLALLLVPGLMISANDDSVLRAMAVVVLGGAAAAIGASRRLQAPLLIGAGVLAVHAIIHLAPWVAQAYAAVPLWGTLATVGLLLLVLGATYERRLQQLRDVRLRVATLR